MLVWVLVAIGFVLVGLVFRVPSLVSRDIREIRDDLDAEIHPDTSERTRSPDSTDLRWVSIVSLAGSALEPPADQQSGR